MQIAEPKSVSRFPARMEMRVPTALRDAVEIAAERQNTKAAEWARRALMSALEAEGIRLRAGIVEAQG
jgi:predicted HicB family RNase H-like nuclease